MMPDAFHLQPGYTKVNVGCGYDHRPGYINVDMDPACKPDILIADNNFSNLPRQSYDEVLAKDVLEHIPRVETPGALLEWADLLKTGGILELQTSNILGVAMLLNMYPNYRDQANFTIYMFGNQAHPGDFHHTGFTELTLKVQVMAAGFEILEFEERDHWLFWFRAKKVWDWTQIERLNAHLPDDQFAKAAVQDLYGRNITDKEVNDICAKISSGLSRREVLKILATTPERLQHVANSKIPDKAMPSIPSSIVGSDPAKEPYVATAPRLPRGRLHKYPRLQRVVAILRSKGIIKF